MEKKITDILEILDKEDSPSQRKIAEETGFSLGLVNILIKKAVKKGLLKIEKLNSRNIKYIITPEGIKEKTKKTINYLSRSYKAIQQLKALIEELALKDKKEGKKIFLLKEDDEIFKLTQKSLLDLNVDFEVVNKSEIVNKVGKKQSVLYHWNPDLDLEQSNLELVNIFRY
ncbi:winged helix-turn-helix transcriptional regulator [Halanaerobium sp. Z-7514]|uniref:Winged helix-turn-helix transcriptional regulator n=1 Tax=Halanaerobium polyolivorans TaxID=2886943 RepID=A0AAW4X1J4_9FIRM|nr:winged helix-turn-helix transcriptional regulator [Halanaerobium polyolivorans]MCC3145647.1 winged helix-turn-helix transcriptional regulator [Halanaerobium polyolivorans]RQD75735.1 MAG: winged helix-turn-helix transcriptional regulator [Halanaerobium sp. MSAO_Bac5]